jgi:DNA-binding NarL/FixJ family response regulator
VDYLFRKNKIDSLRGEASLEKAGQVKVQLTGGGEETHAAANILIATGCVSRPLPGLQFNDKTVIGSKEAVVPPSVAAKLAGRQSVEDLTPRELEVLRLLAEGKPNKLIASALSIAEVTVKSHVRAIFTKLNVLSRTEAIAAASRSGLIRI